MPTNKSRLVRDVEYLRDFIIVKELSPEHTTTLIDAYLHGGDLSQTRLPCGFIAAPQLEKFEEHFKMWCSFTVDVNDAASASVSDGGGSIIRSDELPTSVHEPTDDVALDVTCTSGDGGDEASAKGQRFTFDSPSKAAGVSLTSDEPPPPPSRADLDKMSAVQVAKFTHSMWKSEQDAQAGMVQICEILRESDPGGFASLYKTVLHGELTEPTEDSSAAIAKVHACLA